MMMMNDDGGVGVGLGNTVKGRGGELGDGAATMIYIYTCTHVVRCGLPLGSWYLHCGEELH